MQVLQLDELVAHHHLLSYSFDIHNDTGIDPYMRLELVFPNGTKLIVLPEGMRWDGTELIGLFF